LCESSNRLVFNREFLVEKILRKKSVKGTNYYLVKWKGYDFRESTWEPEQHLFNCEEDLHRFNQHRRVRIQPEPKSRPQSRTSREAPPSNMQNLPIRDGLVEAAVQTDLTIVSQLEMFEVELKKSVKKLVIALSAD
jgi:hypothetical protein